MKPRWIMPDAVIVNAVRTPIGTAFRGSLTETPPEELARIVLAEAVQRSQLDPAAFDDIVLAEANYGGGDLARHAAVEAGLTQVPRQGGNRHWAGSLTAVEVAAGDSRRDGPGDRRRRCPVLVAQSGAAAPGGRHRRRLDRG